jgi:hypothetical protein
VATGPPRRTTIEAGEGDLRRRRRGRQQPELDSHGGVRGAVDASVRPTNTEKSSCYGSLAYGPMVKMKVMDVGVAVAGCHG